MKKVAILVFFGFFFASKLHAHLEENYFGYGSLGTFGGYPVIGGGYRAQFGHQGFDLSAKFLPWANVPVAQIRGLCLLYPNQKGLYIGSGLGLIRAKEQFDWSLTFDAGLGYQWETQKGRDLFFQIEGVVPFKESHSALPVWPAFTFGVGLHQSKRGV